MTTIIPARQCNRIGWAAVLTAAVLACTVAGCSSTVITRDSVYPSGWPDIVTAPGCSGVTGTYLNKGVLIDEAGQEQEVWLTSLLPYSRRAASAAERQERGELQRCARVTLRVEDRPWPNSPNRKTSKLIVTPSRQAEAGPSTPWEPCAGFELPAGERGWPFLGDLGTGCSANYFGLFMNPGQLVYDRYDLQLVSGVDGSLMVVWLYKSHLSGEHVWARFIRVP